MELCAFCKVEETMLFESGVPICLTCAAIRDAKSKKDHAAGVRTVLARELAAATVTVNSATMEFNAISGGIPSAIPPPDGTQRIHNASRALTAARMEMMKAHHRLNDFLIPGLCRKI